MVCVVVDGQLRKRLLLSARQPDSPGGGAVFMPYMWFGDYTRMVGEYIRPVMSIKALA